jgi:hypothetical protein
MDAAKAKKHNGAKPLRKEKSNHEVASHIPTDTSLLADWCPRSPTAYLSLFHSIHMKYAARDRPDFDFQS